MGKQAEAHDTRMEPGGRAVREAPQHAGSKGHALGRR